MQVNLDYASELINVEVREYWRKTLIDPMSGVSCSQFGRIVSQITAESGSIFDSFHSTSRCFHGRWILVVAHVYWFGFIVRVHTSIDRNRVNIDTSNN